MFGTLLHQLIEFALQTAILLGLLWGMIKIQKLDQRFEYNFLGLLGSAALATGLNQILQMTLGRFIGIYFASSISAPIVCTVLLRCLKKVTQAPYVDVLFTAFISYALLFAVNLFILGSLMGDLRPSARHAVNPVRLEPTPRVHTVKKGPETVAKTNPPAPIANPNPAPAAVSTATPNPAPQVSVKPVPVDASHFTIKGITRNGTKSMVIINTGTKTHTLFLGDSFDLQTAAGVSNVQFESLDEDWVTLTVDGNPVKLPAR
jgi:hypothetical protein